jgi:phenylacetate-CoA ligase
MLGIRAGVEVVAAGTYPRTDFKARRVVDDRDLFREMNQKISSENKA